MKKTNNWSLRKKILYTILTFLLVFCLIEITFRIVFFFTYRQYHTSVKTQGSPLQTDDNVLIFKNQPLYVDYDFKYQNNIEGMKSIPGDIVIPEKQKEDFWVLLLGGSAMEGMGSNRIGDWLDITGVEDYPARETIAYKLREILQQQLPAKRVRVFNAANSGYILWQSMHRYEQLKTKIDADWVISMDGNNDTTTIGKNYSTLASLKSDWSNYPIFKFPSKYIIPVTQHSAFINYFKQKIYHFKTEKRKFQNTKNGFPVRRKWFNEQPKPIAFAAEDSSIIRATALYLSTLKSFDSLLVSDSKNHLLILQPFIYNRNAIASDSTEKAVYNYYTHDYNQPAHHSFRKMIADSITHWTGINRNFMVLDANFRTDTPIFVDYCHFTKQASDAIAHILANQILGTSQ